MNCDARFIQKSGLTFSEIYCGEVATTLEQFTTPPPPSASTTPTSSSDSTQNPGSSTPAIAGGTVGGVAVVCLAVVAIFLIRRSKPRRHQDSHISLNAWHDHSMYHDQSNDPRVTGSDKFKTPQELDGRKSLQELEGNNGPGELDTGTESQEGHV